MTSVIPEHKQDPRTKVITALLVAVLHRRSNEERSLLTKLIAGHHNNHSCELEECSDELCQEATKIFFESGVKEMTFTEIELKQLSKQTLKVTKPLVGSIRVSIEESALIKV